VSIPLFVHLLVAQEEGRLAGVITGVFAQISAFAPHFVLVGAVSVDVVGGRQGNEESYTGQNEPHSERLVFEML
jgi:hypothetical protein